MFYISLQQSSDHSNNRYRSCQMTWLMLSGYIFDFSSNSAHHLHTFSNFLPRIEVKFYWSKILDFFLFFQQVERCQPISDNTNGKLLKCFLLEILKWHEQCLNLVFFMCKCKCYQPRLPACADNMNLFTSNLIISQLLLKHRIQ